MKNTAAADEERTEWRAQAIPLDTEQLVTHLDAAYNLARWMTRNEQDAEDIVQESYLRALRYSACYRGPHVKAWLLTIVRNGCYDFLRTKQIQGGNSVFDEQIHSVGQETLSPEISLLRQEGAELVKEAVSALPEKFREVLVLRELEDLSYQEIATVAGIPIGTVMSRLKRGRKQVQTIVALQVERKKAEPAAKN